MRFYSHLNSAVRIITEYKGGEPLASFLKKYFSRNKKYGSTDRKQISHLCYSYFRLGRSVLNTSIEERIMIGVFLCSDQPNAYLEALRPEWNKDTACTATKKSTIVGHPGLLSEIFPWQNELSGGVEPEKFAESFFVQPDLFLRLRPGNETTVREKLSEARIDFAEIGPTCLALPNASKIEQVLRLDEEAVVQDFNSQRTGDFFGAAFAQLPPTFSAWDCCAGSGGKSLLLYDLCPTINLTVSDLRESILVNLKKRFARAGVSRYRSFVTDLAGPPSRVPISNCDLLICDAPCSGSGTWSRTPEQVSFFDGDRIREYADLQRRIVGRAIPYLKEGGFFIYVTCSVFAAENEDMTHYIGDTSPLRPIAVKLLTGYDKKADTLFAALFQKTS